MEQVETEISKFENEEELEETEEDKKKKIKKPAKKEKKKKEEMTVVDLPNIPKTRPPEVEPVLRIPGLKNVKLTSLTQKIMGCIVGEHVTAESPWMTINKVSVDENLYLHHESSDFLPVKDDLAEYTSSTILVGYDPNYMPYEDEDFHRFYIAVTDSAKKEVLLRLEEEKRLAEERLKNSVQKRVLPWESLGSEVEVDGSIADNTRPTIQLELETDIDELLKPVRFRDRNVTDAKDGYMRIGPGRHEFVGVNRACIDAGVQAVPPLGRNSAQTDPGLPANAWTQYYYDMDMATEALEHSQAKELTPEHVFSERDYLLGSLEYNSFFDLYVDDYPLLVLKEGDNQLPENIVFEEYEAYTDVSHCKNKLISCIAWHPMWSGIVALAYSVAVRCVTASEIDLGADEVNREVFSKNYVLLWSFKDALKPRLILESPREVHSIAWSPVDPNLLVGGCSSGQIIIWDLKGRLEAVEGHEYLTPEQQRYRLVMQNLISWLQPQPPAQYVRPAAVSSIQFSHSGRVTHLQWISPYFEWTENGHYSRVKVSAGRTSTQVASCGEDGVVMIWDLNKIPEDVGGLAKLKKKKIRKRPSALTAKISPYKIYDRKFRPIYMLFITLPEGRVAAKLTALSIPTFPIKYTMENVSENQIQDVIRKKAEEKIFKDQSSDEKTHEDEEEIDNKEKREGLPDKQRRRRKSLPEAKRFSFGVPVGARIRTEIGTEDGCYMVPEDAITLRKTYKPILVSPPHDPLKVMQVATDEGDSVTIEWEGFDFHKGEVITTEQCTVLSWGAAVHDGPVVTCTRSPFLNDLILTVGGRVMALWINELKNRPLFWKYSSVSLTCGSWSPFRPCSFHVGRSDGSLEVWDLTVRSDTPTIVQSLSGKVLTSMSEHSLPLHGGGGILGVADYNNSFRLLHFPDEVKTPVPNELAMLEEFVKREVLLRQNYAAWNESFLQSNTDSLSKLNSKESEQKDPEAEPIGEQEVQRKQSLKVEPSKRKTHKPLNRFAERLRLHREKQMQRVLTEKKKLNHQELLAKQQPILAMKQMEKQKREKQREKIRHQQKIFDKTMAMLFPEVVEKPKEGPSRLDEFEAELVQCKPELMKQYDNLLPVHLKYIKDNAFNKRLKWEKVFEEGMLRRNVLDFPLYLRQMRQERFLSAKSKKPEILSVRKHLPRTMVDLKKFKVGFKTASSPTDELSDAGPIEQEEQEAETEEEEDESEEEKEGEFGETEELLPSGQPVEILALKAGYCWQTEGGTYLPGGAVAVAHQFLRCILHQLAPNGVFYQMFQTNVEDSARTEFFRSVAQALVDFNELSPCAPLQLLLETLNAKKTLVPDSVVVICKNMAAYMEHLPLEVGPVQPGSPWLTLLTQMELFFRRLVLLLPSMDDVLVPLAVMTSVFKCPGISSFKSILDPFSKILSFVIQNAVVESNAVVEVCQMCNRAFTRDREKLTLTRMLIIELVQALKFKTAIPDSNFMMLINFVIQDTGNCLVQSGFSSYTQETFSSGINAAEIMRQHLSDALDFLADFHTVSKIKSFCQGDSGGLNEDTLGGALKSGVAQYVALEMARGTRDNRAVARHLPWLYNAPSSLQQGPREFLECMGHVRLLSWLLLGGLFQSLSGHAPCTPIPPEASCHVADHVQVILAGFAGQSKASVLHMSSLFHAFILCQLWTVYLEAGANSSPPGSEPHVAHNTILLDFWGKVTPCILQLVAHSKVLAEMVNLHFLSLLEALLEVNASILGKLMPLWSPVLFAHHVQLPGHMQVRLQNCRNFAPTSPTSNVLLAKWLQRLQFKMGQIELQSSAATQFYSV